jgi:hypothetical protein
MGERQAYHCRQHKGDDETKALTPAGGAGLGFPP